MITEYEEIADSDLGRTAVEELEERTQIVAQYDKKTAEKCARSLLAAGGKESGDLEILESLVLLGLSHAKLAERLDFSPIAIGRRLAAYLDRAGDLSRARAVLELLLHHFSDNRSVDKDLSAIMRRQGQADEVIAKYLERAQGLVDRGKPMDAVPWLQEVLKIDSSRTDVARLVRDLRYQENDEKQRSKSRLRAILWTLLGVGVLCAGVMRELSVRSSFRELPGLTGTNLDDYRGRLARVEEFALTYPAWHGSLGVRREESELRSEIARLEADARVIADAKRRRLEERQQEISLLRTHGIEAAEVGNLDVALAAFEKALEMAGPDWPERERTQADAEAIRDYLEETQ